jgi:hypothetical protein
MIAGQCKTGARLNANTPREEAMKGKERKSGDQVGDGDVGAMI